MQRGRLGPGTGRGLDLGGHALSGSCVTVPELIACGATRMAARPTTSWDRAPAIAGT